MLLSCGGGGCTKLHYDFIRSEIFAFRTFHLFKKKNVDLSFTVVTPFLKVIKAWRANKHIGCVCHPPNSVEDISRRVQPHRHQQRHQFRPSSKQESRYWSILKQHNIQLLEVASTDHLSWGPGYKAGKSIPPQLPSLRHRGISSSKNHLILYCPRGNWKRDENKEEGYSVS